MTEMSRRGPTGADIRAKLNHPVIDGDGHMQELGSVLPDFLKQVAGPELVQRYENSLKSTATSQFRHRTTFWTQPSGPSSIDRATAQLPMLRKERHAEAGIDFAVLFTTLGFGAISHANDEMRHALCRAINMMNADMYYDVRDCMTPAALVPMHTPEEAIEELEFAVNELGLKTVNFGDVSKPVPEVAAKVPEHAREALHNQPLAMDNPLDYDPFWQRCVDLGVSIGAHANSRQRHSWRGSPTNYIFNHLGSFATAGEFCCRSLYLGGVTRRFPTLRVSFLEGGVAWAADLFASIVEAWEKRNLETLTEYLDPGKLDMELMVEMFEQYGNQYLTPDRMRGYQSCHNARIDEDPDTLDEWKALGIEEKQGLYDRFVPSFFFGCEADDALNSVAFNTRLNHFGARLNAFFGSDIGHWDVTDALRVLNLSHELVEDGLMTDEDYRDFTFTNAVKLHTSTNPDFFKGTAVEAEAAKVVAAEHAVAAA